MTTVSIQSPTDDSVVLRPYKYYYSESMERAMAGYIEAMNAFIGAPQDAVQLVIDVVYTVYRSLILADDIIDFSSYRGKIKSAHEVYGVPLTLSTSWYTVFMAMEKLIAFKQPKAVEVLVKHIKVMYEGQAMDTEDRETCQCPTEDEYEKSVEKRCLPLQTLVTDLLQVFVQNERDLDKLNRLLSFWYTAQDDMDDLQLDKVGHYKEDIHEGKFGYPLVIAINRHPKPLEKSVIEAGMKDKASRGSFIGTLLKESNALAICRQEINKLEAKIRKEIHDLGGSEMTADVLLAFRFV